jgi:hypothetical protein
VAHTYNPSYSVLRRQRSGGSWFRGSPGKQLHKRRYLEKPFAKAGLEEWAQDKGPEFKPQYCKKKKKKWQKQI